MIQPKAEIEKAYENPDPWGYQNSEQDKNRMKNVLGVIRIYGIFWNRAIDICCGEGWITQMLPAAHIHGLELSDNAAKRFPRNVKRVLEPDGKYGLVLCTGCLYGHYDYNYIVKQINQATEPGTIILISNIESWEKAEAVKAIRGKQIFEARFPYNEHHQKVRVFQC